MLSQPVFPVASCLPQLAERRRSSPKLGFCSGGTEASTVSPASEPSVLTVGAVDRYGARALVDCRVNAKGKLFLPEGAFILKQNHQEAHVVGKTRSLWPMSTGTGSSRQLQAAANFSNFGPLVDMWGLGLQQESGAIRGLDEH